MKRLMALAFVLTALSTAYGQTTSTLAGAEKEAIRRIKLVLAKDDVTKADAQAVYEATVWVQNAYNAKYAGLTTDTLQRSRIEHKAQFIIEQVGGLQ